MNDWYFMKVVCFGELLLRLKAPGHERLLQSELLEATVCGAEANVAVSLSNYGVNTSYVTVLPNNALGQDAVRKLRYWGVDTGQIRFGEGRFGTFYLETGANQRPSKILYDRSYSAFSLAEASSIDWDCVLDGADWLHISGITPAVSRRAAMHTLFAVEKAREMGVNISCDLNYRTTLWKYGCSAVEIMPKIAAQANVLIANEEDIQMTLGIGNELLGNVKVEGKNYESLTSAVIERYPNLQLVAVTLRNSINADRNEWSACVRTKDSFLTSIKYSIEDIVDRVGAGDSFAAGLIYGLNHYDEIATALEYAVAASCLKHSIQGDFNRCSTEEVEALMCGNANGRVVR